MTITYTAVRTDGVPVTNDDVLFMLGHLAITAGKDVEGVIRKVTINIPQCDMAIFRIDQIEEHSPDFYLLFINNPTPENRELLLHEVAELKEAIAAVMAKLTLACLAQGVVITDYTKSNYTTSNGNHVFVIHGLGDIIAGWVAENLRERFSVITNGGIKNGGN